jgi:aryl-alcohol dehydrogenase-like predicted oxidoreductase
VIVATKLFYPGRRRRERASSRRNVLASCDASLQRLGIERIDLLQIHRFDPDATPVEETMAGARGAGARRQGRAPGRVEPAAPGSSRS